MNAYEFLTQSPKEICKALKVVGINHWKLIPESINDLCKKLNLQKDDRLVYYYPIHRTGGTEWHFQLEIDFGFGKKILEIELWVKGKMSIVYSEIGGYHTWVDIYKKECPLFDKRPEYNNLEFTIGGKEYVEEYVKDRWDDNKEHPVFNNDKPLSEYIKIISDKAKSYAPFILKIEEACFNGEYEKAYDKYHFNPFKVGNMILTEDPGFSGCVSAAHFAKENFDVDLTMDNLQGLYRYMFIHIDEYRAYNNETKKVKKPLASYVNDLFWGNEKDKTFTKEILFKLIELGDSEGLIDRNKVSWDSVYLEANRDLYNMIEKAKEQLSKKYSIPADYIDVFNYDETTDSSDAPEVPAELRSKFI